MKIKTICAAGLLVCAVTVPTWAQEGNSAVKDALRETLRENVQLRSELEAARGEIDRLRFTSPGPAPVAPAPAQRNVRTYTVQKGDTLGGIAASFYGNSSAWRRIHQANPDIIENPNLIFPGEIIVIP